MGLYNEEFKKESRELLHSLNIFKNSFNDMLSIQTKCKIQRIYNCIQSVALEQTAFIYSGPRLNSLQSELCNHRLGKVYTIDDAKSWDFNIIKGYNPFIDFGCFCTGKGCIHYPIFIDSKKSSNPFSIQDIKKISDEMTLIVRASRDLN